MKFIYKEHPTKEQIAWGSCTDPTNMLEIGREYEGELEIHSWHTKVFLDEFPNVPFSSMSFEYDENEWELAQQEWFKRRFIPGSL